ncbi:hypothetical protein D3C83_148310 [compost metagenome]
MRDSAGRRFFEKDTVEERFARLENEYLRERGSHADVPAGEIMRVFRETYPALYGLGGQAAGERFA